MKQSAVRIAQIANELAKRPGHTNVVALVHELCIGALGASEDQVRFDFEVPIPEVRGRMDALLGATVFEFKRDLRSELPAAESQLERYIGQKERDEKRRFLGIATDGADFYAFERKGTGLAQTGHYRTSTEDPQGLVKWLDAVVVLRNDLPPDALNIRNEFGRESVAYRRAISVLGDAWKETKSVPEVELKRGLWHQHLEFVYGRLVDPDQLFVQHTYLNIVAKAIAARALGATALSAAQLLHGTEFAASGLYGAIEMDFFDWILHASNGEDIVTRIAAQVARFKLEDVETDVLKTIYESLIDPEQRHYLGEYYTPDWLAEWICESTVPSPLTETVLDPACGSGTFLFHLVRRFLAAAEEDGIELDEALQRCSEQVMGLDVHPVAVLFARVTYLLAIGPERLRQRKGELFVPVFLGDSLQWRVRQFFNEKVIDINVPNDKPLRFPGSVASDPTLLESILRLMGDHADLSASWRPVASWLNANTSLSLTDKDILVETYKHLKHLHETGRNHIWNYVIRNLTRPLWISQKQPKPTVLIGNPPWLKFNSMSPEMQSKFKTACQERGIWVGGSVATQQDLCAYFFARAVESYLQENGRVVFVMPLAALSRKQFDKFMTGNFRHPKTLEGVSVEFEEAWTFDSSVRPLFPVPSCVVFARRSEFASSHRPKKVTTFTGYLPKRDSTAQQAAKHLLKGTDTWPSQNVEEIKSPYKSEFKNGATLFPRRLIIVTPDTNQNLGFSDSAPIVIGRVGPQDKRPWKDDKPLRGPVEREFISPVLMGESILPYRTLNPNLAILPLHPESNVVMDSGAALEAGFSLLARRLKQMEVLWLEHGTAAMSLSERLNYFNNLCSQYPIHTIRVAYAKSGTSLCASVVKDSSAVIDHDLYWIPTATEAEASYLCGLLNSDELTRQAAKMQSEGQFGKRHFNKVLFNLNIEKFSPNDGLHKSISMLASEVSSKALEIEIDERKYFTATRKHMKTLLRETQQFRELEKLIAQLLDR